MAPTERGKNAAPLRLFFALWPDERLRAALADLASGLAAECGGRATARGNLHVTLAFLGNVARGRLDEFAALADALSGAPFELVLDRVGYWRHNRIVWSGMRAVPAALVDLAAALNQALVRIGWPVDERPYSPHVTLVRDARRGPAAQQASLPSWPVKDFVLVSSTQEQGGVQYEPLRRWPLAG